MPLGPKQALLDQLTQLGGRGGLVDLPIEVIADLLVYHLAADPSKISVRCNRGEDNTTLEFDVGEQNKGRLIGKNGHIVKSLRSLCRSIERARGRDVIIDIVGGPDF